MCAMCLTVRRGTDLCDVCFLIIPWSLAELTFALQQLAMSQHLLEHGANMDPEKVQQLDNTCAWPPSWLCPIPSLHGLSLNFGIDLERVDNRMLTPCESLVNQFRPETRQLFRIIEGVQ